MYCVSIELYKYEWKFGRTRKPVFPELFLVLPNFHECLYNDEEKENNLLTLIIKT